MTTHTGLVIDGPAFGINLSAPADRWNVAQYHSIKSTTYVWVAKPGTNNGVWACGEYLKAWDDWVGKALVDGGHVRAGSRVS